MYVAYAFCTICYTVGHQAMVCPYMLDDNPRFAQAPHTIEEMRIYRQTTVMYRILAFYHLTFELPIDMRQQYDAEIEVGNEITFIRDLNAHLFERPLQNLTIAALPVVRYIDNLAARAVENLDYGVHVRVYSSALDHAFTLALELACSIAAILLDHQDQDFDVDFRFLDWHMAWLIDEMDQRGELQCEEDWALLQGWKEILEQVGIVDGESKFYPESLNKLWFHVHQGEDQEI